MVGLGRIEQHDVWVGQGGNRHGLFVMGIVVPVEFFSRIFRNGNSLILISCRKSFV